MEMDPTFEVHPATIFSDLPRRRQFLQDHRPRTYWWSTPSLGAAFSKKRNDFELFGITKVSSLFSFENLYFGEIRFD